MDLAAAEKPAQMDDKVSAHHTKHERDPLIDTLKDLPRGWKLFVIFVGLILSILLVALDTTIIATAIPQITNEFHSLDQIGWYGSAYFLTNAATQCFWGKAYTYFDMKGTFMAGIGVFEIGTLICALCRDSTTFIIGRAVAGFGGAALASGAFSIIAIVARPEKRPMYIGFMGATYGVASVIGPILGGTFTEYAVTTYYTGWRWCFWINLPVGLIATIIVALFFDSPSRHIPFTLVEKLKHMDFPGVALMIGSLTLFLLPMRWAGVTFAWSSVPVICSLVGAFILLVVLAFTEWKMKEKALIPIRFLKNYQILLNLFYIFFLSGLYMPAVYFISVQFQALQDKTPTQAGIQSIPLVLSVSIGTIIANTCISKFQRSGIWLFTGPILATTGMILLYSFASTASTAVWIGLLILLGLGIGFSLQTPISINQGLVQPQDIPIIVAITLFFEMTGAAILLAASEAAFANRLVLSVKSATDIDPTLIVETGASQLRSSFPAQNLELVFVAYQQGLNASYLVMLACGSITILASIAVLLITQPKNWIDGRQ